MNHYEIILMFNPDTNEKIQKTILKYNELIYNNKGIIHRFEDWGRRQMAYSINKLHKAHYILMNIETSTKFIKKLEIEFRFNRSIIRSMIMKTKKAINTSSIMVCSKHEKNV
ncbi:30S ribosomal protein S6 [Buchnera aphidicola (Taiwanaphis decaspermi)]|uniref:30S ribosomal protein S6 n=1 Tax=Buchnera aphidicola TaxID=9 RepID=UPI0031B819B3